jgi:hemerythrin
MPLPRPTRLVKKKTKLSLAASARSFRLTSFLEECKMLVNWSDDYSLGISKIDEQHKGFFDAVNRLHEECLSSKGEEVIQGTLAFLGDYARNHFKDEEALMREKGYPGLSEHQKLHADFLQRYDMLIEELKDLGPSQELADTTGEMVIDWLVDHITHEDTAYARHMNISS